MVEDDVNKDFRFRVKDADSIEKQEDVYLKQLNLGGKMADTMVITYSRVYIDLVSYRSDQKSAVTTPYPLVL